METISLQDSESTAEIYDWHTNTWKTEPLPDVPPLPAYKPRFNFDDERLILEIRTELGNWDFDLTSITDQNFKARHVDMDGRQSGFTKAFWDKYKFELRGEIENAAWQVFYGGRKLMRLYHSGRMDEFEDFDIFEALKSGATLDWKLGAVIWPEQKRQTTSAVPIFEIAEPPEEAELISDRYLCRGGSMLLTGPTGIGKSSLATQFATAWSLGIECLGFMPVQELAVLIVQAENDAGDLREARDGVAAGLELDDDELFLVNENLGILTLDDAGGPVFFQKLIREIRNWKPDLIVLDPLLAFVAADISKQDVAANFLRHSLNPILHRADIGALILHHTGKPPRENGKGATNHDYAGLGSSELSNWARAICSLTVEGDAYCLTLGKRGKRAGIRDDQGVTRVWLRHSAKGIFWEQADPATVSSPNKAKAAEDLLALVPLSPARILKNSLIEKAKSAGIGMNKARAFLDELLDARKLHVQREKRSGTQPAQYVARHVAPDPELV